MSNILNKEQIMAHAKNSPKLKEVQVGFRVNESLYMRISKMAKKEGFKMLSPYIRMVLEQRVKDLAK